MKHNDAAFSKIYQFIKKKSSRKRFIPSPPVVMLFLKELKKKRISTEG